MSGDKPFDCVELKNRIQAELLREYQGLTPEEERRKRHQKLASGDSSAARMWQAAHEGRETASK